MRIKELRFVSDEIPTFSTSMKSAETGVMVTVAILGWPSGVVWKRKEVERVHKWLGEWLKKEAKK